MVTRKKNAAEPSASEPSELAEDSLEQVTGGSSKPKEIVVVGSKIKLPTKDSSALGGNDPADVQLAQRLLNGS